MKKSWKIKPVGLKYGWFLVLNIVFSLPVVGQNEGAMNIGRFYGKVVDDKGSGVGYATVQLFGMQFDTISRTMKERLVAGQITEENGDFNLTKLPIVGEFTLKISFLGYVDIEKKVTFGVSRESLRNGLRPTNSSAFEVDLGNIVLVTSSTTLETVTVTGEVNQLTLALDRKVYRVDRNAMAAGGTAEDALRGVPSLSIDLNGNLTLRNAAPQLFVDGRPTNLSLDQIPADAIETVEVITNPSAKYDASGGQAGIVNIVLKKERRIGYNGGLRLGADTRGGINAGGDVNAREGKINVALSAFYGGRQSWGEDKTERQNFFGFPYTNLLQTGEDRSDGYFLRAQGDLDWFMDNRNTITFRGSIMRGIMGSDDELRIRTDSLFPGYTSFSEALRLADSQRDFRRSGAAVLYKHLYPKKGKELTADFDYGSMSMDNEGNFFTQYLGTLRESKERQAGGGGSDFYTLQVDYVDPLTDHIKFETGARAAIRRFDNNNTSSIYDYVLNTWEPVNNYADRYKFDDRVYAAYAILSYQLTDWGFQAGLRAEGSQYTGTLPNEGLHFENNYPLNLFPSFFVTRKFSDAENLQLSYSRRINRPNFFQLMPFTDFTDSLNLRRGNPDLLPEFTNSLELSYQKIFKENHNLLVSVYYKQANDLITAYQTTETLPQLNREVVISTYTNSNSSRAYGVEFTLRNMLHKNVELSSNINLYNSRIDASNVENDLKDDRFSWFAKENLTVKLPANFNLQISGEYRSRASFSPESDSDRRGGFHGHSVNTAQGYTLENWFVDAAIRKDLFNRKVSMTISMNDILRTRRGGSHAENDLFIQDSWHVRNPQTVRVNLSYRFGKPDTSLFRRKNTNQTSEGVDMMN